ncbi:bis(5'-nucleosyl)-tetraphosphatase [Angomonas deanei]|uniref:Calcineurin-like phosphoesterase, putative n=1 Tax=Angomonas deanei TaxID=59799 RepID=A0A7G2CCW4_9TRYP|nr:bis(5'-nucleosyl)-tetraphosphatase [Angomonas deanei]CAD2216777.1 Calcineurin-like phosphoesterase, putative [Angomonas deanei]|eukprot:EPY43693.1 bis(5'-nucleosyl)-tetraphosphatase [Angomonas deanei]
MSCVVETLRSVSGRVIILGDLHGCLENAKNLLRELHFSNEQVRTVPGLLYSPGEAVSNGQEDMCVFVGDLINKGPDSYGCIRFLRDIGARGVLGNHDIKMLRLREKIAHDEKLKKKEKESTLLPLAVDCPPDLMEFLSSVPHVLDIPQHDVVVVHAGLDPTLSLEDQEVEAVTRMRNLVKKKKYFKAAKVDEEIPEPLSTSETYVAVERNKIGKPWAKTYSKLVSRLGESPSTSSEGNSRPSESPTASEEEGEDVEEEEGNSAVCLEFYRGKTVVFGHDAKRRLQVTPFAIGLDSGCVYGGQLTGITFPGRQLTSVPGWSADHISNV